MVKKIKGILLSFLIVFNMSSRAVAYETQESVYCAVWNSLTDEERYYLPAEYKAAVLGMEVNDFELFSRMVEMESNRSTTSNFTTEGRVLIAVVAWNRYYSDAWPDTINGVLTQGGQFSTISNGWCSCKPTLYSEWAIIEAHRRIANEEAPSIMYFNCIGPGGRQLYSYEGGNYFLY